jgi:hypothetical protein
MRLLQCDETGGFRLTKKWAEDDLPRYAILSHRWLATAEEPTFAFGSGEGRRVPSTQ